MGARIGIAPWVRYGWKPRAMRVMLMGRAPVRPEKDKIATERNKMQNGKHSTVWVGLASGCLNTKIRIMGYKNDTV